MIDLTHVRIDVDLAATVAVGILAAQLTWAILAALVDLVRRI